MLQHRLDIQMLGAVRVRSGDALIERFRTRRAALLLVYLAYFPDRHHAREHLAELLWPDASPEAGAVRLRQEAASLRRQLEPPGMTGHVLVADRTGMRLHPGAFVTDVARFRQTLEHARLTSVREERLQRLREAVSIYGGEFLPGQYDEWVCTQRDVLMEEHLNAVRQLARTLEEAGLFEDALGYAYEAVSADPLGEEARADLMRIYVGMGRPAAALRQYEHLASLVEAELGVTPSARLRSAARVLRERVPSAGTMDRSRSLDTKKASPSDKAARPVHRCRLPAPITRFFDREAEIACLSKLLTPPETPDPEARSARCRLVTVTGTGGAGKTRLALAAAARLADRFPGGVYFVPLADLQNAAQIPGAILSAMGLAPLEGRSYADLIASVVEGRTILLVLDNFEHLAEEGAALVAALLNSAASVSCLITSRRVMRLEGEREFPVEPLPVPPITSSAEELLQYAAVMLFQDRARNVRPDFAVTERNAASVARLCSELEGLPLAIELAAGWSKVMSPSRMVEELSDGPGRLALLVSRKNDTPHRHRTLRHALAWSYHLLPSEDQALFRRLSVFRGGWSAEAARDVCSDEQVGTLSMSPERLLSLAECSLIVAEEVQGQARFRMLETIREYASERLDPAEADDLTQRHAAYYAGLARTAGKYYHGPEESFWLAALDVEYANMRAALTWSVESSRSTLLELAALLGRYWSVRGLTQEGLDWYREALKEPSSDAGLRCRALLGAGRLAVNQPDLPFARQCYAEAETIATALEDPVLIADATSGSGIAAYAQRDFRAVIDLQSKVLSMRRQLGETRGEIRCLFNLAVGHQSLGELSVARQRFDECLALARNMEDHYSAGLALTSLGYVDRFAGRLAAARESLTEALVLHRKMGHKGGEADALHNLAVICYEQGDYDGADDLTKQSIAQFRQMGNQVMTANVVSAAACTAMYRGDLPTARTLWTKVLETGRRLEDRAVHCLGLVGSSHLALYESNPSQALAHYEESRTLILSELERKLSDAMFAPTVGRALTDLDRVDEARSILHDAATFWLASDCPLRLLPVLQAMFLSKLHAQRAPHAARLLGAWNGLRGELDVVVHAVEKPGMQASSDHLRSALPIHVFEEELAAGAALPLSEIIAFMAP